MNSFHWLRKRKELKAVPKHFGTIFVVERVSQVPDEINIDVYIVRRGRRNIWAVFTCPCGTHHRLTVNLSKNRIPFWRAITRRGSFSLSPSISLKEDCYSHFWIENHRIVWVNRPHQDAYEIKD